MNILYNLSDNSDIFNLCREESLEWFFILSSCSFKFYLSGFWEYSTLLNRLFAFAPSRSLRLPPSQDFSPSKITEVWFQASNLCENKLVMHFQRRHFFPQFVPPSPRAKAETSKNPTTNLWGPAYFSHNSSTEDVCSESPGIKLEGMNSWIRPRHKVLPPMSRLQNPSTFKSRL